MAISVIPGSKRRTTDGSHGHGYDAPRLLRSTRSSNTIALAILVTALSLGGADAEPAQQNGQVALGVEWKLERDGLRVIKVVADSPAEHAGFAKGDRVLVIDGTPTIDLSDEKLAELLKPREGAPLLLTVVSGEALRTVRLSPGIVEFPDEANAQPRLALVGKRFVAHDQRAAEEAFKRRIVQNIERLRGPVTNEIRFLTKVASLPTEQVELLQAHGWSAIERGLWPNQNGAAGRLVLRQFVGANGIAELREELIDAERMVARRELARVLKDISLDAWQTAEAVRQQLDRRRRWADVLVQVAAFDDALLLTRAQRESLGKLLFDGWSQLWRGHVVEQGIDLVGFAASAAGAMDLFSIPPENLEAIFRPSQIVTFHQVQLPTKLDAVILREPRAEGACVLHHGLPLSEERARLHLLLQCLIDDADAHAELNETQKQKLLLAGKLDVERYVERRTQQSVPGKIIIVKTGQIGGAKVRLPSIFSAPKSMFFKALQQRLDSLQLERISSAHRERRRFHVQAVLHLVATDLADVATLTDHQQERILADLAERWSNLNGAAEPEIVRALMRLSPEDVVALLDDWQLAAAHAYLRGVAVNAQRFDVRGLNPAVPVPAAAGGGVF